MTNLIHLKKEIEDIKKLPYYSQVDGVLEVKRARLQGYQLAVEDFEKMIDEMLNSIKKYGEMEYNSIEENKAYNDAYKDTLEELKSKLKGIKD